MRDNIFKMLPIVIGVAIGWMIFNPPSWLSALGPLAWVVNLGLCALLLLVLVAFLVLTNLPETLKLEPLPDSDVPPDVRALGEEIAALGFRRAGTALRVMMSPSATLVGYVHEKEPVYATVFRTGTVPAKTSFDFVSILHGDKGGLTTNANPEGAVLPAGDSSLRQVFADAKPEQLFRHHLEGLQWLTSRGIPARPVSDGTFRSDFLNAIGKQRQQFLAAPLRGTLVTFWRAATKSVPFVGPLASQKIAEQQVTRLLGT